MRLSCAAVLAMVGGSTSPGRAIAQATPRVVPVVLGGDVLPGHLSAVGGVESIDCGAACAIAVHVTMGANLNAYDALLAGCPDSLALIAQADDRVAGLPVGARLAARSISGFAITPSGAMVWNGSASFNVGDDRAAIFAAEPGGAPRVLAMVGELAAQQDAGWRWRSLGPVVRSAGPAMWYGTATLGTETSTGLYAPGAALARHGDTVPGTREAEIASFMATAPVCRGEGFAGPWTLHRGDVLFATATTGAPIRPLLAGDGPLAGFPATVRLAAITGMGADDFGETVMTGTVTGPAITAENASTLWRWRGDSPEVTMRGGDPLPGGGGARTLAFEHAVLNANGDIIASVTLTGAGVTAANDTAVLLISRWGLKTLIAREGAPVGASGDRYDHLSFGAVSGAWTGCSNAAGRVLLIGPLVDDEGGAAGAAVILWSPSGGATILAREGGRVKARGRELEILNVRAPALGDGTGMNLTGGQDGLRTLLDDRNRAYFIAATTLGAMLREGAFRAELSGETCLADVNADGFLDGQDASAYAEAFERGTDAAELNGDGFLDFFDYEAFAVAFETGC